MKYVVFKRQLRGLTVLHPVIFPNHLVHADVAEDLTKPGASLAGWKVDSAGSVSLFMEPMCNGLSETLGVRSKPERDSRLIRMNDYGAGLA